MALTITCPVCGKRNGYEFRYGGEDKGPRPDGDNITPEIWCEYVHMNKCIAGIQKEWWFHRDGCGSWFTIYRDTTTNLEIEEPEPELKSESGNNLIEKSGSDPMDEQKNNIIETKGKQ